ncbi:MAG: ankyrin repeat domain-containing protein [Polyangiaceae bacterium]
MSEPLFDAIRAGDLDRLAELLAGGADPNVHAESHDGFTALQAAVDKLEEARPLDAVVLLLRYGAVVNDWDRRRESTPLLIAVFRNQIEAVRVLLAAGADPNVRGDEGDSPLRFCAQEGFVDMARLLLLCGATKTIDEWGGERAMTALGLAARGLHVEMVKLLLAHGADPQGQDVDRFTPLDCLAFVDSPEDPAIQSRLQEIRRLLGAADSTAPTSDHNGNDQ